MDMQAKLDKLDERLDSIERVLIRNTSSLEEHVRRTNILEEDMKPVKGHVTFVNNAAKLVAACASTLLFLKSLGLL